MLEFILHARPGAGVETDRQHHHLHTKQAGNRQSFYLGPSFLLLQGLLLIRIVGMRLIANFPNRLQNFTEPDTRIIPTHPGATRSIVDLNVDHAIEIADMLFIQPDTGRAGDAFENQTSFAVCTRNLLDKFLLNRFVVVYLCFS